MITERLREAARYGLRNDKKLMLEAAAEIDRLWLEVIALREAAMTTGERGRSLSPKMAA